MRRVGGGTLDSAKSFPVGRYIVLLCLFQHSGINSSNAEVLALFNVTEADAGEYICKVPGIWNQRLLKIQEAPAPGNLGSLR